VIRPTPQQLRALRRLVSPDYAVNGVVCDPRWAGISKATIRAITRRGWADPVFPPDLWGLTITDRGRAALDLAEQEEEREDTMRYATPREIPREYLLGSVWHPGPNDLTGGWCVTDRPERPSLGAVEIADFISEETANHIAGLHNRWLLLPTDELTERDFADLLDAVMLLIHERDEAARELVKTETELALHSADIQRLETLQHKIERILDKGSRQE
jgi:hypothetical protein